MGKTEKKSYRTQIIVALIGVVGVLGTAIISNWDKIFKKPDREPERPKIVAEERALREVIPLKTTAEKAWESVQNIDRALGFGELLDDARAGLAIAQAFYEEKAYEQAINYYKDVIDKCNSILQVAEKERQKQKAKHGDMKPNSIGMELVYLDAGLFIMGSRYSAAQLAKEYNIAEERFANEFPQHEVRISQGFWMSQTEVTQGQYKSVMNAQPWSGQGNIQESTDNPAVYVSWHDAEEFCRKLSLMEDKTYRLPTEAEWEYACRAGTTTRFSFGDSYSPLVDYAWFGDNTNKVGQRYARPVGRKKPNPWGLFDMHGNVLEWCSDNYDEDYYSYSPNVDPKGSDTGDSRSLRGGSWPYDMNPLRCSYRFFLKPVVRTSWVGFRVVQSES